MTRGHSTREHSTREDSTREHSARPLLVTGLPRSGTSWVGRMLAAGGEAVYVNEPLNPRHPPGRSPGVLNADVRHAFQYIDASNEQPWAAAFDDTVRLRYRPLAELRRNRRPYDLARMVRYATAFAAGRLRGRRALLDDPYAVLSTAWFVRRLGCRAVVLIRDPVALVGSWQRLGWTVDVRELLDQPLLAEELPGHLVTEMRVLAGSNDHVAATALLWRAAYTLVDRAREHVPGVVVCRYEDLAADPLARFPALYAELGLTWNGRAARRVRAATGGGEDSEAGPHRAVTWSLRGGLSRTAFRPMPPSAAVSSRQGLLAPAEGARVRALTFDLAARFYRDTEGRHAPSR